MRTLDELWQQFEELKQEFRLQRDGLVRIASSTGDVCRYYHQFVVVGGSAVPTSGSQVFGYTIDGDSQDITIDYDMTDSELKTHILSQFSALESADLDTDGGPWPEIPLEVRWKGEVAKLVAENSPPTIGTNTLNNNCWAGVWPVPSWGR